MSPNNNQITKREAKHECREHMGIRILAYQKGLPANWAIHGDHSTISNVLFCPFCGDRLPQHLNELD